MRGCGCGYVREEDGESHAVRAPHDGRILPFPNTNGRRGPVAGNASKWPFRVVLQSN